MNQHVRNILDDSMTVESEVKRLLSKQELTLGDFDNLIKNCDQIKEAATVARQLVYGK
jgi:hypothetical protein